MKKLFALVFVLLIFWTITAEAYCYLFENEKYGVVSIKLCTYPEEIAAFLIQTKTTKAYHGYFISYFDPVMVYPYDLDEIVTREPINKKYLKKIFPEVFQFKMKDLAFPISIFSFDPNWHTHDEEQLERILEP